jgi:hypothetical protein
MNAEQLVELELPGEIGVPTENGLQCQITNTSPPQAELALNPGHRGGKTASSLLSRAAACSQELSWEESKVVPVVTLASRHKDGWGSGGIAPGILKFGIIWIWVTRLTSRPLHFLENYPPPRTHCTRGWLGSSVGLDAVEKIFLPLPWIEPRFLDHPVRDVSNKYLNQMTEQNGLAVDSCSGGTRFEASPKHLPSWVRMFVVSLSPSRQMLGENLNWATATSYQIISNPSVINQPSIRRGLYSTVDIGRIAKHFSRNHNSRLILSL